MYSAGRQGLTDPAADRPAVVGPFAARIFTHHGHPGRIRWTEDLDDPSPAAEAALRAALRRRPDPAP
jgi:hypothetical protein